MSKTNPPSNTEQGQLNQRRHTVTCGDLFVRCLVIVYLNTCSSHVLKQRAPLPALNRVSYGVSVETLLSTFYYIRKQSQYVDHLTYE